MGCGDTARLQHRSRLANAGRARDDASHRSGCTAGLGDPATHRLEHDHRRRHQWRAAWTAYTTSSGATTPPTYRGPDATTAPCANGAYYCAARLDNTQPAGSLISPETKQEIAGGAERLGRQAGVIGAAATAASAVPGPHQPITGATAVGATAIDIGATVVEQLVRPDTGKLVVDTALTGTGVVVERVPVVGPVAAPITNEMLEEWKKSGASQSFQQWVNQQYRRLLDAK